MEFDLATALKRSGLSQTALADKVGVNKSFISEMVNGKKTPSFDVLLKLMAALDASPNDLSEGGAPTIPGMSEPPVTPYVARSDHQAKALRGLLGPSGVNANHIALHEMTRDVPGLLLLRGDILVVDMRPKPRSGQIVLVQAKDPVLDEYTTELGVMRGASPVPAYGSDATMQGAQIMGVVTASVRLSSDR